MLEYTGDVTLSDPHVVTDLPLPDTSSAELTVSATLKNHADAPRSVVLHGAIDGGIAFEKRVDLAPGESRRECFAPADYPVLRVVSPRLWWPNGYGEQELYTMTLGVDEGAVRSDTEQVRFGIRELSYELTVDAPSGEELRIDFDPTDDLVDGRSPFDSFHRSDPRSTRRCSAAWRRTAPRRSWWCAATACASSAVAATGAWTTA